MKVCSRCGVEKEDGAFGTQKYKGKVYLRAYCKDCCREYLRAWARKKGIKPKTRKFESIPETKVCSYCGIEKSKDCFRIRTEKRHGEPFRYLNNTCMECDKELAKDLYKRKMSNPENRKNHNEWAKQRYWRRRDKYVAEAKKYREKPESKARRKDYIKENKEKIAEQERITKQRYHEKNKNAVTDEYVINKLVQQKYGTREEVEKNTELIEWKRVQILTKRLRNTIAKMKKKS